MTVPGVGAGTVEAVPAHTDEVRRFRRGNQFGPYFGLTRRLEESGPRRRTGCTSKGGPSAVRCLAVKSAWRGIRHSPALGALYESVTHGQKKRNKIPIVATARRLLTIMRAMLMTGEAFNQRPVSEQALAGAKGPCPALALVFIMRRRVHDSRKRRLARLSSVVGLARFTVTERTVLEVFED